MAVYGKQEDLKLNKNAKLYIPGQTQLTDKDIFLGGTGTGVTDAELNGARRIAGETAQDTANAWTNYEPTYNMQNALAGQLKTQTDMFNQQASDQAAKIRQAIASQTMQGENTKTDYTNQMNAAIGTLNTEKAKIPGQVTNLNNSASSQGVTNAQKIRSALAQMGLLQSGESGTQQLLNDTTVSNQQNANKLTGLQLESGYTDKISNAQTDLASKVKAINDAIAMAQSQGDENALSALKNAQANIANAGAQSAVDYNNFAYTASRDAVGDRAKQQAIEAQAIRDALEMTYQKSKDAEAASRWEKEFEADQAYKRDSLAASQARASSSGGSTKGVDGGKYSDSATNSMLTQFKKGLEKGVTIDDLMEDLDVFEEDGTSRLRNYDTEFLRNWLNNNRPAPAAPSKTPSGTLGFFQKYR